MTPQSARALTRRLQKRIAPTIRYSQSHFEEHVVRHAARASALLDVGCGHRWLSGWRVEAERELVNRIPLVVGIDYDLESLAKHRSISNLARGDARLLPFKDGSFDLVTANMVVEHLDDPPAQFAEIARVLRPGGIFLFHTPNTRSYFVALSRLLPDAAKKRLAKFFDGREESDVFPTHYRANRPDRIGMIAASANLEVAEMTLVSSVPVASNLPPIALFELLVLRQLEHPALTNFRSNIICALRKKSGPSPS